MHAAFLVGLLTSATDAFGVASRRDFVAAAMGASVGFLLTQDSATYAIDDLSMPSEEEEKARQVSASRPFLLPLPPPEKPP